MNLSSDTANRGKCGKEKEMRKTRWKMRILSMLLAVMMVFASVPESAIAVLAAEAAQTRAAEGSAVIVAPDETVTLSLEGIAEGASVVWESSNEKIATVENGIVTGVKKGTVTVTASVDDQKAETWTVYVNHAPTLKGAASTTVSKKCGLSYTNNGLKNYFTDADNDTLTFYHQITTPDHKTVNAKGEETTEWTLCENGGITYKITSVGTYYVRIKAYDGVEYSPEFVAEVTGTENKKPYLIEGTDNDSKAEVYATVAYSLPIGTYFADADNSALYYYLNMDGTDLGQVGKDTNKTTRFTYTTTWMEPGEHTLIFSVSDGWNKLEDAYKVTVTVKEPDYSADVWQGVSDVSWYNDKDTEFTLTKPAQLAGLAAIVNGNVTGVTEDFSGKTLSLGNDIVLNDETFIYERGVNRVAISDGKTTVYMGLCAAGTEENAPANTFLKFYKEKNGTEEAESPDVISWTPIGNSSKVFKGTFDGKGYTVKGIYHASTTDQYVGLFGNVNGTIKNLTIDGLVAGKTHIGAVTGYVTGGTIENCTNYATVVGYSTNKNINSGRYVGGIAGNLETSAAEWTGTKLFNQGSVQGSSYTGGIIGQASASKKMSLEECINTGYVDVYTSNTGVQVYVGGVAGNVSAASRDKTMLDNVTLEGLVNRGTVGELDSSKTADYIGGVIGGLNGLNGVSIVRDCYNTGKVYGYWKIGGVFGSYTITATYSGSQISGCYNAGKMTTQIDLSKAPASTLKNYGSFAGFMGTEIEKEGGTAKALYYTAESMDCDVTKFSAGLEKVSEETLRSDDFPGKLGDSYALDKNKINQGFPILTSESEGSNAKSILSFALNETAGKISGKNITFQDYEISVEGTVLKASPVITVSDKATVRPASGEEVEFVQDKENPALYQYTYYVTAENGSVSVYTVSIYTKASVSGVSLNKTETTVIAGYETEILKATVTPANALHRNITWKSSDSTVATVDENGLVTGISAGKAEIMVTTEEGAYTAMCTVTVKPYVAVESISLPETASVIKSQSIQLKAMFTPENASDQGIVWSSTDTGIATVDENGLVTGIKEGEVKITATTKDGEKTASCIVRVEDVRVEKISVTQTNYVMIGKGKRLKATITPSNATNQNVIWSSSDKTIASVDENGVVRGLKEGTVTIQARAEENETIFGSVEIHVCQEYSYQVGWSGVFNQKDNNNVSAAALPKSSNTVEEAWRADVGNSSSAIVGDYVYTYACASGMMGFEMAGETKTFYKINKNTGEIVDKISDCPGAGGYYYGYTIYGDGLIYVICPGAVMAFDIDAFELLWTCGITYRAYCSGQYINGYVVANGCVVDGITGKLVKNLDGKYNFANGAVHGDYFYIAGYDGKLHVYNVKTWEELDAFAFKDDMGESSGWTIISQPGVLYYEGCLYWGDGGSYFLHSVKIKEDGKIDTDSYVKIATSQDTRCTPVAANGRIYLAGQKGEVDVFDAKKLTLLYTTNRLGKIQSTPILYADPVTEEVYIYVQDYEGSDIYYLKDTKDSVSGQLKKLVTPSWAQYAFEQLSCDSDGALYATNDAGILFKFVSTEIEAPTFTRDLKEESLFYVLGSKADALEVTTSLSGAGSVSYQWQKSTDQKIWTDIEGAVESSYLPDTTQKGDTYYRCTATNTWNGKTASAVSRSTFVSVIDENEQTIKVRFRLIGATKSTKNIDFEKNPGNYYGSEYVTWIGTTTYEVKNGTTLGELFEMAMEDAGLSYVGLDKGYISSITAPASEGGKPLKEFDNGGYSGWMYTVNGSHPVKGLNDYILKLGDNVVFHYVNDYRYEDESSTSDTTYLNKWLEAEDKAPLDTGMDQVKAVEALIDAIGTEITAESKKTIEAARAAYDDLVTGRKKLVNNYDKLVDAEKKLAELEATAEDKKAAEAAEALIDAIGTPVTLDKETAVKAARKAYDALTERQKVLVGNYESLEAAENALLLLKNPSHEEVYKATGDYLENLGTPGIGSVGGEWMVVGLLRSGRTISEEYYEQVAAYVKAKIDANGRLHQNKSSENSRMVLALTAAGYDPANVGGHNLLTALADMSYLTIQGLNGPIWALIAFDSHNYEIPQIGDAKNQVTRERIIEHILNAQVDGGWNIYGDTADVDMTAMAIQALAPYYRSNEKVKAAVDTALARLSELQDEDGGFSALQPNGSRISTSESTAQVIVALTALGINPETDARFVKNGNSPVDALCAYAVNGGGLKHTMDGRLDGMATEQGYYALTAYMRLLAGQTSLYDMSDVTLRSDNTAPENPDKNPEETVPEDPDKKPGETVPGNTDKNAGRTGDATPVEFLLCMAVLALGMCVVLVRRRREEFSQRG